MSGNRGGIVALMALTVLTGGALSAQEPPPEARRGARMGADPEMIMSMRERLDLTDEQLAALEELRAENVARRTAHRTAMEEMRSRLRAGEIGRDEMRAFVESLREQAPPADERRARLEAILDEAQMQTLDEMRARRGGMRGGGGAMGRPGRGMRGDGSGVTPRRGRAMMQRGAMMERRGRMLMRRGTMMERQGRMLERRSRMLERRGEMPRRRPR